MTRAVAVDYPPHGRVTFREIAAIHKRDIGKTFAFYQARWIAFGKPATMAAWMFTMPTAEVKRRTGTTGFPGGQVPGVTPDRRYLDPSYLPHIPFGDLAHLSAERNTGAARPSPEPTWRAHP